MNSLLTMPRRERREAVSLGDFGAIGGGDPDDTTAILTWYNEIPEGGTGLIPDKLFRFTSTMAWNRKVELVGLGSRSALLPDVGAGNVGIHVNDTGSFLYRVKLRNFAILNNAVGCSIALLLDRLVAAEIDLVVGAAAQDFGWVMRGVLESNLSLISTANFTEPWNHGMPLGWVGKLERATGGSVASDCNANRVFVDIGNGVNGVWWETTNGSSEGNSELCGTIQGMSGQGLKVVGGIGGRIPWLHYEGNGEELLLDGVHNFELRNLMIAVGGVGLDGGRLHLTGSSRVKLANVVTDSCTIEADCEDVERDGVTVGNQGGQMLDLSSSSISTGRDSTASGSLVVPGRGTVSGNFLKNGDLSRWSNGPTNAPDGFDFYTGAVGWQRCGIGEADTTRHISAKSAKITSTDPAGLFAARFAIDLSIFAGTWWTGQVWAKSATGGPVAYTALIIDGAVQNGPYCQTVDEWEALTLSRLIPAGAASAYLIVGPNAVGSVHIADLYFGHGKIGPRSFVAPAGFAEYAVIGGAKYSSGTGSPNGVLTGSPPDVYLDENGGAGATLWVKESGVNTDTGWVAK